MKPIGTEQGIATIWTARVPLIGMVHLLPLPGAPGWGWSMNAVLERAAADAMALTDAGFDGVIVENYSDQPFYRGAVPTESVAAITAATARSGPRPRFPSG